MSIDAYPPSSLSALVSDGDPQPRCLISKDCVCADLKDTTTYSLVPSTTNAETYWPATLLSRDISDNRILSFGYDADVVNLWSPASQSCKMTLEDTLDCAGAACTYRVVSDGRIKVLADVLWIVAMRFHWAFIATK